MTTVNIHAAKTHLSKLIDRAVKGEPFIIAKAGRPLVKVVALEAPVAPRRLGFLVDEIAVPRDFNRMGEAEIAALFGDRRVKFLLDTQILLWAAGQPDRLSAAARRLLNNPRHDLLFSAASFWEIAIKRTLGRADFHVEPRALRQGLLDHGYTELAVTSQHALGLDSLAALHKDPFDRLLLAQAASEDLTLLTSDAQLARYPGPIRRL